MNLTCELKFPNEIVQELLAFCQPVTDPSRHWLPFGLNTSMHWYVNTISSSSRYCAQ
jgi:hypothetical protein